LTQTPFFENGYWYATIPSNDQYPHAPWWSHSEDEKIWGYNPTAAIAGFIYTHSLKEANKLFAKEIIQRAINDFLKGQFDEMHELRNFIELYEHIKDIPLFGSLKEFGERLEKAMLANVEKDESKWFTSYCVRPSQYIYEKNMVGYTLLRDYIQKEISMLPDHLDSDGVWPITWEWGQFPEEFAKAKQIWKGILAIRYLKIDKEL